MVVERAPRVGEEDAMVGGKAWSTRKGRSGETRRDRERAVGRFWDRDRSRMAGDLFVACAMPGKCLAGADVAAQRPRACHYPRDGFNCLIIFNRRRRRKVHGKCRTIDGAGCFASGAINCPGFGDCHRLFIEPLPNRCLIRE